MTIQTAPSPGWLLGYVPSPSEWDDWWKCKAGSNAITCVAAGNNSQVNATALLSHIVVATTVAANAGVRQNLPYHMVLNKGANALQFWPQSGVNFNNLSANVAISIPVDGVALMVMTSATQAWISPSVLSVFADLVNSTPYATDAAAAAGGVVLGQVYHNGSILQVRMS